MWLNFTEMTVAQSIVLKLASDDDAG